MKYNVHARRKTSQRGRDIAQELNFTISRRCDCHGSFRQSKALSGRVDSAVYMSPIDADRKHAPNS